MLDDTTLKSFVLEGGDRSVQDIVSKLKFLSKIKTGEKLDVNTMILYPDNLQTTIYRTLLTKGESRLATFKFMCTLFNDAFELASKYLRKEDPFLREMGNMIMASLQEAKSGIEGFMGTYSNDRLFVSQLETLSKTLDAKLADLQRNINSKSLPVFQIKNEYLQKNGRNDCPPLPSQIRETF